MGRVTQVFVGCGEYTGFHSATDALGGFSEEQCLDLT